MHKKAVNIQSLIQENSRLKDDRSRALIQMATSSRKTYTAITFIYRLLKFADIKKALFFVDTKNLGEQAEQELIAYVPNDENRKITELYNVQRLRSNHISSDSQYAFPLKEYENEEDVWKD